MKLIYSRGHIKSLDGIRGVAIILVLINHLYSFYPFSYLANFGWSGVDLFFVLSGFLITGILYDTKNNENYYRTFITRRILRIFPLYYLIIILVFLFAQMSSLDNFKYLLENKIYFFTYTQNFFFAFNEFPNDKYSGILNHLWSLAIEEQFYIFWPLIILLLDAKYILWCCTFLIVSALLSRNLYTEYPFFYTFTFCRTDSLAIGAFAAVAIREFKEVLQKILPFLFSLLAFSFILFIVSEQSYLYASNKVYAQYGYTLVDLFYVSLLLLCFETKTIGNLLRTFFSNNILIFFGKYSYGIYIFHFIINVLLTSFIKYRLVNYIADIDLLKFIVASIILVVTVTLSFISYHFFEKKFLLLKDKLSPVVLKTTS